MTGRGGSRRARAWAAAIGLAVWGAVPAAAAGAYDEIIAPIFRARCAECHGGETQKAKLALHTWDGLQRGSDAGPVIVPGQAGQSVLLTRMRLPLADEEHMPPADHPQPAAEEIALLARWIERGAGRDVSVAELQLPEALARAAAELPAKLAAVAAAGSEPLWELDAAAVTAARAALAPTVAALQRRFPGALSYESRTSAALHFTAAGLGRDFDDANLAALLPLREQLVHLDLSGTGITDAAAGTLGQLGALRVFRAGYTRVGDGVVAALARLPKLEAISLSGTAVTAASTGPLARMRGLRLLRVAGTAAEQASRDANLPVAPGVAELLPALEPDGNAP